jgi:hypothetical protein
MYKTDDVSHDSLLVAQNAPGSAQDAPKMKKKPCSS